MLFVEIVRWSVSLCCENVSPDFQTSASRSPSSVASVWLPLPPPGLSCWKRPSAPTRSASAPAAPARRDVAGKNRPRLLRREKFLANVAAAERDHARGDCRRPNPPGAKCRMPHVLRPRGLVVEVETQRVVAARRGAARSSLCTSVVEKFSSGIRALVFRPDLEVARAEAQRRAGRADAARERRRNVERRRQLAESPELTVLEIPERCVRRSSSP